MSEERSKSTRGTIAMLVLASVFIGVAGVHRVSARRQLVELGYELTQTSAKLRAVEQENRRLHLSYSLLTSPTRIQALAQPLGLGPVSPGQVQNIDQDGLSLPSTARLAP